MTDKKPEVTPLMKGLLKKASLRNSSAKKVSLVDVSAQGKRYNEEALRAEEDDIDYAKILPQGTVCVYHPPLKEEDCDELKKRYYHRVKLTRESCAA